MGSKSIDEIISEMKIRHNVFSMSLKIIRILEWRNSLSNFKMKQSMNFIMREVCN